MKLTPKSSHINKSNIKSKIPTVKLPIPGKFSITKGKSTKLPTSQTSQNPKIIIPPIPEIKLDPLSNINELIEDYDQPFNIPELGWRIFKNVDIDTMIDLYRYSDPQYTLYHEVLNTPYVLRELAKKYKIPVSESFIDFISKYNKVYPTSQCFLTHTISECYDMGIKYGNVKVVEEAFERGFKIGDNDYEMMIRAIESNNLQLLKLVIEQVQKEKIH